MLAPRPAVREKNGGDRLRGKGEEKAVLFPFHKEEQLPAALDGADVGEKCFSSQVLSPLL